MGLVSVSNADRSSECWSMELADRQKVSSWTQNWARSFNQSRMYRQCNGWYIQACISVWDSTCMITWMIITSINISDAHHTVLISCAKKWAVLNLTLCICCHIVTIKPKCYIQVHMLNLLGPVTSRSVCSGGLSKIVVCTIPFLINSVIVCCEIDIEAMLSSK